MDITYNLTYVYYTGFFLICFLTRKFFQSSLLYLKHNSANIWQIKTDVIKRDRETEWERKRNLPCNLYVSIHILSQQYVGCMCELSLKDLINESVQVNLLSKRRMYIIIEISYSLVLKKKNRKYIQFEWIGVCIWMTINCGHHIHHSAKVLVV